MKLTSRFLALGVGIVCSLVGAWWFSGGGEEGELSPRQKYLKEAHMRGEMLAEKKRLQALRPVKEEFSLKKVAPVRQLVDQVVEPVLQQEEIKIVQAPIQQSIHSLKQETPLHVAVNRVAYYGGAGISRSRSTLLAKRRMALGQEEQAHA